MFPRPSPPVMNSIWLNLAGFIGSCSGHHSSLDDAIKVKVIGLACDDQGVVKNIADVALLGREARANSASGSDAGACMNSRARLTQATE